MIVLACAALLVALVLPAIALAKGHGRGNGRMAPGQAKKQRAASAENTPGRTGHSKAAKSLVHRSKKAKVSHGKAAKAGKVGAAAAIVAASDEPSGGVDPSETVGPIHVGRGVPNAFSHITRNIEKAMAKVAAGTKKQVPPGLMRVWMKFAGWLGVTSAPPWQPPAPVVEPTATVEPTGTVEPTETVPVVVP